MKKQISTFAILVLLNVTLRATPPATSPFIRVDQFGYRTMASKVAVIIDPQQGFDASSSFNPSVGDNQYQLRKWSDSSVVFTGTITPWKGGATDASSGDKAWWFDFSSVTTPGSYYVFDVGNKLASYKFEISDDVYNNVLRAATRMFFYNRCGIVKSPANAGANWADGASFIGTNQDTQARSESDRNNSSTAKDLSGGWWDAGDYNKYVTFARLPMHQLLDAYAQNPSIWSDQYNIPESGNGLPDLIDEIKWELEWLKKMQLSDGSSLIKVGSLKDSEGDAKLPPSTDPRPRYYYAGSCTSSTIALASMFSHAALILKDLPTQQPYAEELKNRAIQAWTAYNNTTTKTTDCDNGNIQAGDADWDEKLQEKVKVQAAAYLFALTNDVSYQSVVDQNYTLVDELGWWGPYNADITESLLYYAYLPNSTGTVASAIKAKKLSATNQDFYKWSDNDPYRCYLRNEMYHWGSNLVRATVSMINSDLLVYNIDSANKSQYKLRAEEMIHYFHGVNPFNMVYLTNMDSYGAENSVNEVYHSWYKDGTAWDNAKTSSKGGPAPGYVPGGPNASYAPGQGDCILAPPCNQPLQKSYRDWNGIWPDASWSVTEPAIYYQSAYIKALSRMVTTASTFDPQPPGPTAVEDPIANKSQLLMFPNPCTDKIIGHFSSNFNENIQQIKMFNSLGQEVRSVLKPEMKDKSFLIDATGFYRGQYIIQVITSKNVFTKRVEKQ